MTTRAGCAMPRLLPEQKLWRQRRNGNGTSHDPDPLIVIFRKRIVGADFRKLEELARNPIATEPSCPIVECLSPGLHRLGHCGHVELPGAEPVLVCIKRE